MEGGRLRKRSLAYVRGLYPRGESLVVTGSSSRPETRAYGDLRVTFLPVALLRERATARRLKFALQDTASPRATEGHRQLAEHVHDGVLLRSGEASHGGFELRGLCVGARVR